MDLENRLPAACGQQLPLIRQPVRQPVPRPLWLEAQRVRGERARQRLSVTERDNLLRFYRSIFTDRS